MAVTAWVASNRDTGMPHVAMISEDGAARIIDESGEVSGSAAALRNMRSLYQRARIPFTDEYAFELYATARGNMAISEPLTLDMGFPEAATAMRDQIAAARRATSAQRQGRLDQVSRARRETLMDDPTSFLPGDEGLDEAWRPEAEAEFRAAAAPPPIPYTPAEQAERVAFLQQWLAEQGPEELESADE